MARPTRFMTMLRDLIRDEVAGAMVALLSLGTTSKRKPKNGRRKRRGPGRPKGSKNKPT